jgi:uncharacterized repeat protein (TIGR03803 family)
MLEFRKLGICLLIVMGALATVTEARAWTLTTLFRFAGRSGTFPRGDISMDQSGNVFGAVLECRRSRNCSGIYELTPPSGASGWTGKLISETPGAIGDFIFGVGGNPYGTAVISNPVSGTVYRINLKDNDLRKTIYKFNYEPDEETPTAGLTYQGASTGVPYDDASPLYSTTLLGGTKSGGTAYELTRGPKHTWTKTTIYNFCSVSGCLDGEGAATALVLDSAGNLYGTTGGGGASDAGVVFKLTPGTGAWTETVLHSFCSLDQCADGGQPHAGLIIDSAGNLYGTASTGGLPCVYHGRTHWGCGGTAFKLAPDGDHYNFTVLHAFCQKRTCPDGTDPDPALTMDSAGNLYGVTFGGGLPYHRDGGGGGTVFEISGTEFQTLCDFYVKDPFHGYRPNSRLLLDASGNLFGTTADGGRVKGFRSGTFFELSP